MNKKFYFISGLPRSGSSLLVNILNQNRDMYASPTSGVLQIVKPILTGWDKIAEFKANANELNKKDLISGIFSQYYSQNEVTHVFDKCRAWPSEIETLEWALNVKPKIILCVRDVRDILSSWENMYRRDKSNGKPTPGEQANPAAFQNIESRCDFWARGESPLGSAFNVMMDARHRGFSSNMYYFEFEKWTKNPSAEFGKLYEWLGIENFQHDFNNVKQTVKEKDEYYGYSDLHTIKEGKVIPSVPRWPDMLTKEISDKYIGSNIWSEKAKTN